MYFSILTIVLFIKIMKNLVILLFLISFNSNFLYSQDSELKKDIKELLALTGSAKLGIQMMNQMIPSYKLNFPEVPEKFWEEFIKKIDSEELVNLIIPIYEKHYTSSEIKELLVFYKTPIGQKTISLMPLILQESMDIGVEWGRKIGGEIIDDLIEQGYYE